MALGDEGMAVVGAEGEEATLAGVATAQGLSGLVVEVATAPGCQALGAEEAAARKVMVAWDMAEHVVGVGTVEVASGRKEVQHALQYNPALSEGRCECEIQ